MVVFVPIAFGAPAVFVLIPPAVPLPPATFSRGVQFTPLVICLPAVAAMSLHGLVEFMLGMSNPALTAVDVLGVKRGKSRKEKDCCQDRAGKDGRGRG